MNRSFSFHNLNLPLYDYTCLIRTFNPDRNLKERLQYDKIINVNSFRFVSHKNCQHFNLPCSYPWVSSLSPPITHGEHDSAHAKAEWAHSLYPAEHSFSFQSCHLCTLGQAVSPVLYVESDLAGIFHSYWSLSWYLKSEKCFNFLIINLAEYLMQW